MWRRGHLVRTCPYDSLKGTVKGQSAGPQAVLSRTLRVKNFSGPRSQRPVEGKKGVLQNDALGGIKGG